MRDLKEIKLVALPGVNRPAVAMKAMNGKDDDGNIVVIWELHLPAQAQGEFLLHPDLLTIEGCRCGAQRMSPTWGIPGRFSSLGVPKGHHPTRFAFGHGRGQTVAEATADAEQAMENALKPLLAALWKRQQQ